MPRPSIFTHLTDNVLDEILSESEIAGTFSLVKSSTQSCWMVQLAELCSDIAIINLDNFGQQELDAFSSLSFNPKTVFIILDNGMPNEYLDRAKRRFHCYHFRAPIDYELVTEAIIELGATAHIPSDGSTVPAHSVIDQFGQLQGSADVMRNMYKMIRKVAAADSSVLIVGESGTGKELVANTIHLASHRSGPLVSINCAALSAELVESELFGHVKGAFTGAIKQHDGVFEQAKGGTLFLDEIAEMPLDIQVKLLRVMENGEFRPVGSSFTKTANVRIITATNRCLLTAITEQRFREDLYFRLAQFPILVPALRERGKDIMNLVHHFLAYRNAKNGRAKTISPSAQKLLQTYHWPGNVRQLRHVIERAFILADLVIKPEHLHLEQINLIEEELQKTVPPLLTLFEVERIAIEQALHFHCGDKVEAAKQLGVSLKTLYNKLEKYLAIDDRQNSNCCV